MVERNSKRTTARPIGSRSWPDRSETARCSRLPPSTADSPAQPHLGRSRRGLLLVLALVPALVAFISTYGLVANPANVTQQPKSVALALPKEVQNFLVYRLTSIFHANRPESR